MSKDRFNEVVMYNVPTRYIRYSLASGNVNRGNSGQTRAIEICRGLDGCYGRIMNGSCFCNSSFSNSSGNDDVNTNLVIGSKDSGDGNVTDLQKALNKLGASLTADGKFGQKTKDAVKKYGYAYPVTASVFYKILGDANKGDASSASNATVSEADMKKLWEKDKAKFGKLGKEPDFDKWLKRQKNLAGIKDFGKGVFTVAGDWFKQKNADSPTGDDYHTPEPEDTSKIWGLPAPIVYVGSAIGIGLIIWGGIALATRKPKQVIVQAVPTPAV